MTRSFCAVLLGSMLGLAWQAGAQSPKPPETYSFQATSSLIGPEMTVRVNRNGSKELIERIALPRPGVSAPFHDRVIYDFQAHRIYTVDLNSNICTTQQYESPNAPIFDPVGGSGEILKGMPSQASQQLPREVVNGISTKKLEVPLPDNGGKYQLWLDEKFNFIVKWAIALGTAPPTTQLEIRDLSYAPSSASLFETPKECKVIGGVTSATGGHVEMTEEVHVPTQTHQFGEAETRQAPASARGASTMGGTTLGGPRVTAVRLHLVPESYSGACPTPVQLVGEITADGPGTVWYNFLAGAVNKDGPPEGTVRFDAAGTKTVTLTGAFRRTPAVPHTSMIAVMEDEQGVHGPRNMTSGPVDLKVTCTGTR